MSVEGFSVPGWSFGEKDAKAMKKLDSMREKCVSQLPPQYQSGRYFITT
jgi:hypothetical protein